MLFGVVDSTGFDVEVVDSVGVGLLVLGKLLLVADSVGVGLFGSEVEGPVLFGNGRVLLVLELVLAPLLVLLLGWVVCG